MLKYASFLYVNFNLTESIHFLDVGQGDSILITGTSNTTLLIDGGPGYSVDSNFNLMFPFKRCPVDLFLLTHPHKDHLEGLLRILYRCEDSIVIYNPVDYDSQLHNDFVKLINTRYKGYLSLYKGDLFSVDTFNFVSIWPSASFYNGELNDSSIVLLLYKNNFEALFTGDIGSDIYKRFDTNLINFYVKGNLDLVKLSHHGAINGYDSSFFNEHTPHYCPISVGENSFGHPSIDVISELISSNCKVLRTDLDSPLIFR